MNDKIDLLLEQLKADSAEYGDLETADYSSTEKKNITRLQVGAIVNAANSQMLRC